MGQLDDQTFAQKAMEANMAEIAMAKLALQKASSDKVKEFAQMMIDEHGSANDQLKAMVSGVAMGNAPEQMGSGTAGAMGNTDATGGSTTTSTSGTTGTGTTGTTGTSSTTTGTGTTTGSDATTGSGTTGSGSMGAGTSGTTGTGTTGTSGSGTTDAGTMGHAGSHATTGTGSADFNDPTMLSPEHRAMMDKLTKLTGASFDREYMMGQVKDHQKTAALFESQIKNGKDARLKEFATTLLPSIKKHGQMASDIANSMRTGSSSSKSGSSGK